MAYSTLEKRVTSLEEILATFITTTSNALTRLEKEMREFKDEIREFKDEMKEFKDEMREFKDEIQKYTNKTDRVIAELNKKFGDMTRRMGTVVEDLVFPAVPRQLRRKCKVTLSFFGIRIKRTIKISKSEEKNKEFDAIGVSLDQNTVYLCYVKTTLRDKDIDLFQEELKEFKTFFPEHKGKKLVGILASMNYSDELLKLYEKEGFLYMAPSGYALEIKNQKDFKPKLWDI